MDLRQLRYFVVLAEELHFGRAAKRLALTQPPLSQAIRNLEGELGRLAVGYLAATAYSLLPLVLRDFARGHPGVKLELRELTLPQQFEALRRGDIQVGLLRPPVTDAELDWEILMEERFALALPASHPLCGLKRVPARRLAGETFVMFPRLPGLVNHDLVMGFCLRHGFTPRVAQEANQTHTVIGLVAAGMGVALVPLSAQRIGLPGVAYRPLREATPLSRTALAWRRADASPVLASFRDVARRVAKQVNSRPS